MPARESFWAETTLTWVEWKTHSARPVSLSHSARTRLRSSITRHATIVGLVEKPKLWMLYVKLGRKASRTPLGHGAIRTSPYSTAILSSTACTPPHRYRDEYVGAQ